MKEQIAIFIGSVILGGLAALVTYGLTSNGDTAVQIGVIVWLAAWLGVVFLDPSDLF